MPQPDSAASAHRLPGDLAGWVRYFQLVELPVLPSTAEQLEELRLMEDSVDVRALTEVIAADPLMTLKLLAYTAQLHRQRRTTDAETVREALVLIGITPFFAAFGPQPTVTLHLEGQASALEGLQAVVRRAERAARFALGFAVHRQDHDAMVIYEAALLHDFAEMLLWLHAPSLALEIRQRQQADPTLRSVSVQRELLGTTLSEVQHALMEAWRLPELLVHITDDRREAATQVRNVLLAIRLARHSSQSWSNPALADDLRDIGQLLTLGPQAAADLIRELEG